MFRTTASILLISLFMLAQYGRQVAYLQCKIENFSVKTNTATCDCEKNTGTDLTKTDNKLPPQKTHTHISLDEYYELNESAYTSTINNLLIKFPGLQVSYLSSFNGNIFHPPQS
jgi:hypothetical protein